MKIELDVVDIVTITSVMAEGLKSFEKQNKNGQTFEFEDIIEQGDTVRNKLLDYLKYGEARAK